MQSAAPVRPRIVPGRRRGPLGGRRRRSRSERQAPGPGPAAVSASSRPRSDGDRGPGRTASEVVATSPVPDRPRPPLVIRERDAELVELPSGGVFRLPADAGATGHVLGANRLLLPEGVDGAKPHLHARSTEFFYVLDGELEVLLGEELTTAGRGDPVVVPPGLPHAFGAAAHTVADLIAVITPGVERFGYFHHLRRIALGRDTWGSLTPLQDLYDVHFVASRRWQDARG